MMKKLKMIGFAFIAMLAFGFSASALDFDDSLDTVNGKLSYTKEADEEFDYQFVKMSSADFNTIKADVTSKLNALEPLAADVDTAQAKVDELIANGVTSGDEYDAADAELTAAATALLAAYQELVDKVKTVAPYDDTKWTSVTGTATSGEMAFDTTGYTDDDVVVLWLKDADLGMTLVGEIFTKDGSLDVPVDTPAQSTTDTNKVTPTKTSNVKNPKTGVNVPVASGIAVIALAGSLIYVVRKKGFAKQI